MAAGLIALVVTVALLALLAFGLARGARGFLALSDGEDADWRQDPMFREEAETVTRPPELDEAGQPEPMPEDPSRDWVYDALTPVDVTAAELALETVEP